MLVHISKIGIYKKRSSSDERKISKQRENVGGEIETERGFWCFEKREK